MGQPAAKQGDQVVGTDTHIVIDTSSGVPVPVPLPHPFAGILNDGLCSSVKIMGMPAATVSSQAKNAPPHIPTPPGTSFQNPPSNEATIIMGSTTVTIGGESAARNGDKANTCNDPAPMPVGTVIAVGTVNIG